MTISPEEKYLAAKHDFYVLKDYYAPEDVQAANTAISDLLKRCEGREFKRDEKRLFDRYCQTVDTHDEFRVTRYRKHVADTMHKAKAALSQLTLGATP